jgi:hypothetical protein
MTQIKITLTEAFIEGIIGTGEIVIEKWHKSEGDAIKQGEPVVVFYFNEGDPEDDSPVEYFNLIAPCDGRLILAKDELIDMCDWEEDFGTMEISSEADTATEFQCIVCNSPKTATVEEFKAELSKASAVERMLEESGLSEKYKTKVRNHTDESLAKINAIRHDFERRLMQAKESGVDIHSNEFQSEISEITDRFILENISYRRITTSAISTYVPLSELDERERKVKDEKRKSWLDFKTQGMQAMQAVICPHCQARGDVYRKQGTRVIKTRVNSILGRMVGLGTNTNEEYTSYYCGNCSMEWEG